MSIVVPAFSLSLSRSLSIYFSFSLSLIPSKGQEHINFVCMYENRPGGPDQFSPPASGEKLKERKTKEERRGERVEEKDV